jgi:hypothetical protein
MEPSHSGEAIRRLANQEFPNILWIPNVHYHVNKSPSLNPILLQMNPVNTSRPIFLTSIFVLSSLLCLVLPSGLFLLAFPQKSYKQISRYGGYLRIY